MRRIKGEVRGPHIMLNEEIARRTSKEGQLKEKINSQQKEITASKKETEKTI